MFVSDTEIAQEIVKVNTFIPMKIGDCELKMSHLKQCVSLATPVWLLKHLPFFFFNIKLIISPLLLPNVGQVCHIKKSFSDIALQVEHFNHRP